MWGVFYFNMPSVESLEVLSLPLYVKSRAATLIIRSHMGLSIYFNCVVNVAYLDIYLNAMIHGHVSFIYWYREWIVP